MSRTGAEAADRGMAHLRRLPGAGDLVADGAAALALLTRLPAGRSAAVGDRVGAAWFPLVGLLVGCAGGVPLVLLGAVDPTLAAVVALAAAAVLTGALHLDGLADTADALIAPDAARAEAARTDPGIGVGGASALLFVVGTQVAALAVTVEAMGVLPAAIALAVVLAASRLVPVVLARLVATPARPTGFGAWFARRVTGPGVIGGTVVAVMISALGAALLGDPVTLAAAGSAVLLGLLASSVLAHRRGGLDGDLLGASVELSTAAGVVILAILARS